MEDEAGIDWKIVAVAEKDPKLSRLQSINDLDEHYRKEIMHFFEVYKTLENKAVTVKGWSDKADACKKIEEAMRRFAEEIK